MLIFRPCASSWPGPSLQHHQLYLRSLPDGDGVDGLVGGLVDRLVDREGDPSLAMFVVCGGGQG